MTTIKYSFADFDKIRNGGFEYELPEYSLLLINKISKQVGAPTYIKTPIFRKHNHNENDTQNIKKRTKKKGGKHGNIEELSDDQWKTIRVFDKTEIKETNDEKEIAVNGIRSHLNKITDKNYDVIKGEIEFIIYELKSKKMIDVKNSKDELWEKICNLIIETSASNEFYSEQYVILLHDLSEKYKSIMNSFNKVFENRICEISDIKHVNPDEDYEQFCKNNIEIQRRKSFYTFVSKLYKYRLIAEEKYEGIIRDTLNEFITYIDKADMKIICEELSELVEKIIGNNHQILCDEIDDFDEYIDTMRTISEKKAKEHVSLSSKSIFKFCDIVDIFDELE